MKSLFSASLAVSALAATASVDLEKDVWLLADFDSQTRVDGKAFFHELDSRGVQDGRFGKGYHFFRDTAVIIVSEGAAPAPHPGVRADDESFVREAFKPYKSDPAGFCADDWAPVSKVLPRLVGYPDGQKLFKALTAWAEPLDEIPGSPEAWDTVAEWLGTRCWHRPSLLSWKRFIAERRFIPAARTEAGLETERRAKRLLEIDRELGLR